MTGAVFWICQILLFTIGTGEIEGAKLLNSLGHFIGTDNTQPDFLHDTAGSLLTVFGLIAIFVTGLLLDMVGSIFFLQEMRIFGRHVSQNKDWLDKMTSTCSSAVSKDYQEFKSEFDDEDLSIKEKIQRLFNSSFHFQRFKLRSHYRRLQTFLLAYIHVYSANGGSEQLMDHVHVWRTARAISTALFIVALEAIYLINNSNMAGLFETLNEEKFPEWLSMLVIHFFLLGISAMLTLKSYNRMNYSLFTLACATNSFQASNK